MSPVVKRPIFCDNGYEIYHEVEIISVEDTFDPYYTVWGDDTPIPGKRVELNYIFSLKEKKWTIPFSIEIILTLDKETAQVTRKMNYKYSDIYRTDGYETIIKLLLLINKECIPNIPASSIHLIKTKELFFHSTIELLKNNQSQKWTVNWFEEPNLTIAQELFFEKKFDAFSFTTHFIVPRTLYPFGKFYMREQKLVRSYLILPHHSFNALFIGTWNDCLEKISDEKWCDEKKQQQIRDKEIKKQRAADEESTSYRNSNWKEDYFYAMTDGQMGSYEDFEGDLDSLAD